jgi:hypothetical protein
MNESSMASISEFMIPIDIEGSAFVTSLPISKSMTIQATVKEREAVLGRRAGVASVGNSFP